MEAQRSMKRRSFLVAALLPAAAAAQQPPPLVGVMRVARRADDQFEPAFRRDMARMGWEDGKNYRLQILFADGDSSRLPAMANELVKAGSKVLVAFGNSGVAATQRATPDIPIVAMANDLVAAGLVSSMARPGGNTTGISILAHELDSKRLEVLHEIVPQARKIGVVTDDNFRIKGELEQLQAAATRIGLALTIMHVQTLPEIAPAMAALGAAKVEAVQFLTSPFLHGARAIFMAELSKMKLPTIYEWPETIEEGGLVSYGPRITLCYRHVAVLVNKVLRGAKPADLPIEQPATFVLAINVGAARTIGLTIPEAMLLRADVVVD
jgi:putative ABC transport system substrate-binding protein